MVQRPELEIASGALAGKRFAVPPGGLRLGRSSSNDICIPDEELSRNHCLFEAVGEDGIRLTDLASANGTSLNGRVLDSAPADLKVGDVISVGSTILRVSPSAARPRRAGRSIWGWMRRPSGARPPCDVAVRRSPTSSGRSGSWRAWRPSTS